jgi:hypothetical protein
MNTEEFLKQDGIKPSSFDNQMRNWSYTESQLLGFAERYHQAELKLLGIGDVVGQSEQVKCWNCGVMVEKTTEELTTCSVCGSEN